MGSVGMLKVSVLAEINNTRMIAIIPFFAVNLSATNTYIFRSNYARMRWTL